MIFEEINTKKVVALDTALKLGTVDGVYIDKTCFEFLGIAVAGTENYLLNMTDIIGKEDYITVDNAAKLLPAGDNLKISIGQKVLTRSGKELGKVNGILLGRKYIKIFLEDCSLAPYKILAASADYIVVNLRAPKPSACSDCTEEDIKDSENDISEAEKQPLEDNPQPNKDSGFSPKVQFEEFIVTAVAPLHYPESVAMGSAPDYSFLLGRKVEREISDLTRTFCIAVGTIITDQVLANAKRAGKIVDLAINSTKI